jgi:hypothetical protein
MADSPLRRLLTGFPAVQEPRDATRSLQVQVQNIRERLRLIEQAGNALLAVRGSNPFPEAPADGNTYGRRNKSWWIIKENGLKFTYSDIPPPTPNAPGDEWFESDSAILYTWVNDGSSEQWVELTTPGQGAPGSAKVVVDQYTIPGTYTWTKPAGAAFIEVVVVGGGGGGGYGSFSIYGYIPWGGGAGGGGGGYLRFAGPADALNATETVVVGDGGLGGSTIRESTPGSGFWTGDDGAAGGNSSFAGIIAYGGGGGDAGANFPTDGGGGAGGAGPGVGNFGGDFGGVSSDYIGHGGGVWNIYPVGGAAGACNGGPAALGLDGGAALNGGQSGGSGAGSFDSSSVIQAGGNAYEWGKFDAPTVICPLPAPGVVGNGIGLSGLAESLRGAGGTGACNLQNTFVPNPGPRGGDGQQPGGGGGGGGAGTQARSGPGGNGGAGIVFVLTYIE